MLIRVIEDEVTRVRPACDGSLLRVNTTLGTPTKIILATEQTGRVIESTTIEGPAALGLSTLGWRFFQTLGFPDFDPLIIEPNVRTILPLNGRGPIKTGYGTDHSNWLNEMTARFYPDDAGDFFTYRLNLYVTPLVNNKTLTLDFDIGTANRIAVERFTLTAGAGTQVPMTFTVPNGASETMKRNGGGFYIWSEAPVKIARLSVLVSKNFSARG